MFGQNRSNRMPNNGPMQPPDPRPLGPPMGGPPMGGSNNGGPWGSQPPGRWNNTGPFGGYGQQDGYYGPDGGHGGFY